MVRKPEQDYAPSAGLVPLEDVRREYRGHDLFILTSQNIPGMFVVEAIASGKDGWACLQRRILRTQLERDRIATVWCDHYKARMMKEEEQESAGD